MDALHLSSYNESSSSSSAVECTQPDVPGLVPAPGGATSGEDFWWRHQIKEVSIRFAEPRKTIQHYFLSSGWTVCSETLGFHKRGNDADTHTNAALIGASGRKLIWPSEIEILALCLHHMLSHLYSIFSWKYHLYVDFKTLKCCKQVITFCHEHHDFNSRQINWIWLLAGIWSCHNVNMSLCALLYLVAPGETATFQSTHRKQESPVATLF